MAPKKRKPAPDTVNQMLSTALRIADHDVQMKTIDSIDELLQDQPSLNLLASLVSQGASIESVEMTLGMHPGMLERWLRNGEADRKGYFRALYLFYCRAASGARVQAELAMLTKNPDKWLEKVDVRNRLRAEPSVEAQAVDLPKLPDEESRPLNKKTKSSNPKDTAIEGFSFLEVPDTPVSLPEKDGEADV